MRTNEFDQLVGDPVPGWTAVPRPGQEVLTGRFVELRPFGDEHVQGLFDATCSEDSDALWTYMSGGPFRLLTELRDYVDRHRRLPDCAPYAIVVDGVVEGFACYLNIRESVGAIEIGAITYGHRLQRTAAATEAQYLFARHAFGLGYRRYEWKCDSLNEPSRQAALRYGFTYEGRFRQALVYKGRNRDTDWFSMTDGEWEQLEPAFARWLDGVGPDGVQHESLRALTAAALQDAGYVGRRRH